jgi:hypothetical protein
MSRPQNPLNEFRTYSYYFILGVAADTEAAMQAANSLDAGTSSGSKGNHIILLNGAKDIRFIIKSVGYQSMLAPNSEMGGETFYHTQHRGGDIILQEPMGISYYNVIHNAGVELGCDPIALNYFLKPIFVGYKPDQPPTVISTVKPYFFLVADLTSTMDESGAIYSMKTMGVVDGISKTAVYQSAVDGFSLRFPKDATLKETFSILEYELGEYYFRRLESTMRALTDEGADGGRWLEESKDIKYFFHLDDAYSGGDYIIGTNFRLPWKEMTGEGFIYQVQGVSGSLETLIKKIMLSSCKVVNDRAIGVNGAAKITRKFSVNSVVVSKSSDVEVHYYITAYDMEFLPEGAIGGTGQKAIEFDYIYTGKNIDIRKFDMKFNMGLLWFNSPVATDTIDIATQLEVNKCVGSGGDSGVSNKDTAGGVIKVARGLDKKITDNDIRNKKESVSTSSYLAQMRRWSGMESIATTIEIKGNPQLLEETLYTPQDILSQQISTYNGSIDFSDQGGHKGPVRVKINVKFPREYTNPRSNFETFWYDGYYYIMSVDNKFEEGDYYQVLNLYGMPSDTYGDTILKDVCNPCGEEKPTVGGSQRPPVLTKPPKEEDEVTVQENIGDPGLIGSVVAAVEKTAKNMEKAVDGTIESAKQISIKFFDKNGKASKTHSTGGGF